MSAARKAMVRKTGAHIPTGKVRRSVEDRMAALSSVGACMGTERRTGRRVEEASPGDAGQSPGGAKGTEVMRAQEIGDGSKSQKARDYQERNDSG